jgi:hypothetical protein
VVFVWQFLTLMYENGKIRHIETIPAIGEGKNKGE